MSGVQQIAVTAAEADQRLDRWFRRRFPGLTHGRLEKLLRTGQIRIDGARAKAADRLTEGQIVRIPPLGEAATSPPPATRPAAPRVDEKEAAKLRRAVLYKDAEVLIIDKPAGLAVQGGSGLATSLDAMLDALIFEAAERPRLVHRLDRDTSGCLVLARSRRAAQELAETFRSRAARKIYWAVAVGCPKPARGRIDAGLAKGGGMEGGGAGRERVGLDLEEGKRAVTYYAVLDQAGAKASFLALMPVTGRTHQLRAHCAAIGTPILGDGKYAGGRAFLAGEAVPRQLHLHARSIRLPRPGGRSGFIEATAPLPAHMKRTFAFFGFDRDVPADPFAELAA